MTVADMRGDLDELKGAVRESNDQFQLEGERLAETDDEFAMPGVLVCLASESAANQSNSLEAEEVEEETGIAVDTAGNERIGTCPDCSVGGVSWPPSRRRLGLEPRDTAVATYVSS
jgi:hypothetical protein